MPAGLQVELPAVPRADDVLFLVVILQHPGVAVVVERLLDPAVDAALADRALQMGALVVPGDQLAIDLEHADLGSVAGDHLATAVVELVEAPYHVGFHCAVPWEQPFLLDGNLPRSEERR